MCEFVCELLVLSCTLVHAETDVALFEITVFEGFVFESSSGFSVCFCAVHIAYNLFKRIESSLHAIWYIFVGDNTYVQMLYIHV